jgi:hypothetical protein
VLDVTTPSASRGATFTLRLPLERGSAADA